MTVGIKVGSITAEIGTSDFFHAFFSTVSYNLEERWGSRFPALLNHLYQGSLEEERKDEIALFVIMGLSVSLGTFIASTFGWYTGRWNAKKTNKEVEIILAAKSRNLHWDCRYASAPCLDHYA